MAKRIGVLTGGGDAPGQNVCLKSLVMQAVDRGFEIIGIRKGWEGLLNYNPDDGATYSENFIHLNKVRVRDIDRMTGAYLHSSRLSPDEVPTAMAPEFLKQQRGSDGKGAYDFSAHISSVIARLELDALIVIGDRVALAYAALMSRAGIPIIGIPKTVHNDIDGTDYTLGFSTALGRGVRFIYELRAMAASREEIAAVEILGRSTGLTTMMISLLAGADRLLIPEVPFDPAHLAKLLVNDKFSNPSNYAILVISEAATIVPELVRNYLPEMSRLAKSRTLADAIAIGERDRVEATILDDVAHAGEFGFRVSGIGPVITEILENLTGQRILFQPLSYLIRTGEPDGQDLLGAMNFAALAFNLFLQGKSGRMVAYRQHDNYIEVPLELALQPRGNINVADYYDAVNYVAKPGIIWSARV